MQSSPSLFSSRMQSLLAEKESDHQEAVAALKSKHNSEMQTNKELLAASEATNTDLQKEVFSPSLSLSPSLPPSLPLTSIYNLSHPFISLSYIQSLLSIYLSMCICPLQNDDLQIRISRSRNRSVLELNQGLQEATKKFEKEKLTLMEQNKQLRAELDRMNSEKEQLLSSRQDQESELRELRQNKELLTQWERQIADIIQWVTEEKDARYA